MKRKANAIVISESKGEDITKYLSRQLEKDWNWLPPVKNKDEFYEGIQEGIITNDIEVIFILDTVFDKTGENKEFEKFVAEIAPYCFFNIIKYTDYNDIATMKERISLEAEKIEGTENMLYYFIPIKNVKATVNKSLNDFMRKTDQKEVVQTIMGEEEIKPLAEQETQPDFSGSKKKGKIISVTSSKGGSGKSTVAMMISTLMANIHKNPEMKRDEPLKIIMVDLDTRDGQLGFFTGTHSPTVMNLYREGTLDEDTIVKSVIHNERLNVDFLLSPKMPRTAENMPPEFFYELIQNLKTMYDYVVLDTSVNYLDVLLEKVSYPISDMIILVTDISFQSLMSVSRWIKETTTPREQGGMGINKGKIGVVINKFMDNVEMPVSRIEKLLRGLPIIGVIGSQPQAFTFASNTQNMSVLLDNQVIYKSILKLVQAIIGK